MKDYCKVRGNAQNMMGYYPACRYTRSLAEKSGAVRGCARGWEIMGNGVWRQEIVKHNGILSYADNIGSDEQWGEERSMG
jgi:hypothetical protein